MIVTENSAVSCWPLCPLLPLSILILPTLHFIHLSQDYFTELYVENSRGDFTIFKLADLEGPIVIAGPNRAVAAEYKWKGMIFGNNFPVVNHYQVGSVCPTAGKRDTRVAMNAR